MKDVINILQKQKVNKFSLITAVTGGGPSTAAKK
jgi:hypothetical protein